MKCCCDNCGNNLEFDDEHVGERVDCPHCGIATELHEPIQAIIVPPSLPKYLPPPCAVPQPHIIVVQQEAPRVRASINSKSELMGGGCVLQVIALLIVWAFPIGTILGVTLFIFGSAISRKPVCSRCGSLLTSRRVVVCPGCNADF
jgi:DNA-directed RNA polymerase subunit RPC12/RpoP